MQRGLRRAADAAADNAVALGYVTGWRVVRLMPEASARRLFDRIAEEVYRRDGRSVQRLRSNLAHVRPDLHGDRLEELTRDGVHSYLRYWCESFRLPSWPLADLVRRTHVVDEHRLRDPLAAGQGVVVALPHMANWDWGGAWACGTGMPLMTVAERLKPERLYDAFVSYRKALGMEILPLNGGEPAMPRLEAWVRNGGFACLLADRDLSRTGVDVELCGRPARMPRGPALLARSTGAPLVPATLHYQGLDLVITFHPEVPHRDGDDGLKAMMQDVADVFTESLREHPEDWHMMQRVFVEDLAAGRG